MQPKELNKIASLVKDSQAWNAFIYLLDDEEKKVVVRLMGKPSEYDLISIAAQYNLIQNLRRARENALVMEKELINA